MRILINIFILLFSFVLIITCINEERLEEIVYIIPVEDRCVFTPGDTLLYNCSNGSIDTVLVKEVDFQTERGTYTFLGTAMHNYITETQSMVVETFNDNWNYEKINSRCFRINTSPKYDDYNVKNFPYCKLFIGCEYQGSKFIVGSLTDYDEKIFSDKSYKKVYYESRGDMNNGFEIYWNLKYGIIRFVGVSNGTKLIWQLEDKIL